MKLKNLTCALALSFSAVLPISALAHSVDVTENSFDQNDSGVLYKKAKHNKNLGQGEFDFIGVHTKQGSSFTDEWQFTLADTSDVAINVTDLEQSLCGGIQALSETFDDKPWHKHGHHQSNNPAPSTKLLDNKFLTFSLFDSQDHLLGSAGEGGSISALGLTGGQWYTITVSAKVNGLFGSVYNGSLNISQPTAVPLGDSLPMFASALLVMVVRAKKRKTA